MDETQHEQVADLSDADAETLIMGMCSPRSAELQGLEEQ